MASVNVCKNNRSYFLIIAVSMVRLFSSPIANFVIPRRYLFFLVSVFLLLSSKKLLFRLKYEISRNKRTPSNAIWCPSKNIEKRSTIERESKIESRNAHTCHLRNIFRENIYGISFDRYRSRY